MTDKKINQLLDGYQSKLQNILVEGGVRTIEESKFRYEKLIHALNMIPKMRKFLEEGRREKAFRWLGFLQCVFWMLDIYTVEELANHSCPTKTDIKEEHQGHFSNVRGLTCRCSVCKEYLEALETSLQIT
jgi:hypothetical protein